MKNNYTLINNIYRTNTSTQHLVKVILMIVLGCILLTLSAKIQVPFWPVPMTMQTFVVFIIGMSYGFSFGASTLFSYLILGAIGLPVFAKGGGLMYLTGPTSGYLYGMAVAVAVIGFFADKGYAKSYVKSFLTILIGTIIIFVFGVGYLGLIIGYDKAFSAGLYPFILSETFKIALAVAIIPTIWKLTK